MPVMKWNPKYSAKHDTYAQFMRQYDRRLAVEYRGSGTTALLGALANRNPADRVRIAYQLLDDGIDAATISTRDGINALHVLFSGRKRHDFPAEAPLLERILEGGADLNLRSPRFGVPLEELSRMNASDFDLVPFYEVVFGRPDLDLGVVISPHTGATLRGLLAELPSERADLQRRAADYDVTHRPVGARIDT
jgi:hypothetical protein